MQEVTERPFPDRIALLPSKKYVFEQEPNSPELTSRIVCQKVLASKISVIAVNHGMLAFDFRESELGGFRRLECKTPGVVPDVVMANNDAMIALQIKRLRAAMFVIACIYGVHARRNNTTIVDPLFPGLDEIYNWGKTPENGIGLSEYDSKRLKLQLLDRGELLGKKKLGSYSISSECFSAGLDLADRLTLSASLFRSADPIAMMLMSYQAMILHGRQHAGASIALSAVVCEAAIEEILLSYGLVDGYPPRLILKGDSKKNSAAILSKTQFKKLGFGGMIDHLENVGLIDSYLKQRIEALRSARNELMHENQDSMPRQSGEGLTVVRDLMWKCTGEDSFVLNTPFGYRC